MLSSVVILDHFWHQNLFLSCFPAPAGEGVRPSVSHRQDYDCQASPHGLHHSDDDNGDSDDDDNEDEDDEVEDDDGDDSDEGGVRSPSVSSVASDSSRSATKPSMCFCGCMLYVCVREQVNVCFKSIDGCWCVHAKDFREWTRSVFNLEATAT